MKDADQRINDLVDIEYNARVWNYTSPEEIPPSQNPSLLPESPEITQRNAGIDLTASLCDGLVLSPILWSTFAKYSDPLLPVLVEDGGSGSDGAKAETIVDDEVIQVPVDDDTNKQRQLLMLEQLQELKQTTEIQLGKLDDELQRKRKD